MNNPPQILKPASFEGLELHMVADVESLTVVARDIDGDRLFFFWDVPKGVTFEDYTSVDDELYFSVLQVPRDPRLDGEHIRCVVTDLEDQVVLSWLVTVEE